MIFVLEFAFNYQCFNKIAANLDVCKLVQVRSPTLQKPNRAFFTTNHTTRTCLHHPQLLITGELIIIDLN